MMMTMMMMMKMIRRERFMGMGGRETEMETMINLATGIELGDGVEGGG